MNFLAHQFLSFNNQPIMVGNFLADTIRGKELEFLPSEIARGVEIHHVIDNFTDSHPVVLDTRKILYPYFRKYASVVQDVYYDHFLARYWNDFSESNLFDFCSFVYEVLDEHQEVFNERAERTFYYMKLHNWLYNYSTLEGLDRSLKGLSSRARFANNMDNAIPPLLEHEEELKSHFREFFPKLKSRILQVL